MRIGTDGLLLQGTTHGCQSRRTPLIFRTVLLYFASAGAAQALLWAHKRAGVTAIDSYRATDLSSAPEMAQVSNALVRQLTYVFCDGGAMAQHQRFRFKTKDELFAKLAELGISLPYDEDIAVLFDRLTIADRTLANRFLVHPIEGFDAAANGGPGELTFRRYRRYATGGSAFIWFEATAVVPEGRSNPRQLWLHPGNVGEFARLVEQTRQAAREAFGADRQLICVLQLTHSGRYSKPTGKPAPIIAHHSRVLDPLHQLPSDYPLISDAELDRLQDVYVSAAKLAAEAGFDGVDVKA